VYWVGSGLPFGHWPGPIAGETINIRLYWLVGARPFSESLSQHHCCGTLGGSSAAQTRPAALRQKLNNPNALETIGGDLGSVLVQSLAPFALWGGTTCSHLVVLFGLCFRNFVIRYFGVRVWHAITPPNLKNLCPPFIHLQGKSMRFLDL